MKAAWREAEARAEVREAVLSWREAGAIDAAAAASAESRWHAEGPQLSLLWRALLFVFAAGAIQSAIAFTFFTLGMGQSWDRGAFGTLAVAWGIILAIATEMILDRTRFASTGAAGATALAACALLTAGPLILLVPDGVEWQLGRIIAAWATVVLAAGALRWGMWPIAGGAAVSFLLLLGTFPSGRGLLIVAASLLALLGQWAASRDDLPRPHRWSGEAILAVAVVAIGLAVNLVSLDQGWIEHLELHRTWRQSADAAAGPATRRLCAVATGLLPLLLVAWGVRSRRRVLIDLAIVAGAAAAVTVRAYYQIADLWLVLAGSGAALVVATLVLIRWLASGGGGERGGLTAEPLVSDRRREALLPIAAALAATPEARTIEPKSDFGGQGGGFGGGGASTGF